MSFMKYFETRNISRTTVVMDDYEQKLKADISSLLLKPDAKINEARKSLINMQEVYKILSELNYPLRDEFWIAVRSSDPKNIRKVQAAFRRYSEYANLDRKLLNQVESVLFSYQTNLYCKEFNSEDTDCVIKSILEDSTTVLNKMASRIDLAISQIPTWRDYQVKLEAISPASGWIVSEAKLTVGNTFNASFICDSFPVFKIKPLEENTELPEVLKNNLQDLIVKLRDNPKYNRLLTLYMTRPLSERKYFETVKRDLSLGLQSVLPNHVVLTDNPLFNDLDIWKVKIEEKYLREELIENIKQYHVLEQDAPIRWIERMSNEK